MRPLPSFERLLRERDAAEILGLSPAWLARKRWSGDGPAYVRQGRSIRYKQDDLRCWIAAHRHGGERV